MGPLLRRVAVVLTLLLIGCAGRAHQERRRAALRESLFRAVQEERAEDVAEALRRGASPNGVDDFGCPVLCRAARHADPTMASLLIHSGANVELRDADRSTPLMHAAAWGRVATVRELIAWGSDVNAAGVHGWTALHHAAVNGRASVIEALLAAGAKVSCRRDDGVTPLELAKAGGSLASVQLLLKKSRNVTGTTASSGPTNRHQASRPRPARKPRQRTYSW